MKIHPYLVFDGNAAEAMAFYQKCVGGELSIVRYNESGVYSEEDSTRIAHASLVSGEFRLLAKDVLSDNTQLRIVTSPSFLLAVNFASLSEAEKVFYKLSENAIEVNTLKATDWSDKSGSIIDKFGISWQISWLTKRMMHKITDEVLSRFH